MAEQLDWDVGFNRAKLFNAAISEISQNTIELFQKNNNANISCLPSFDNITLHKFAQCPTQPSNHSLFFDNTESCKLGILRIAGSVPSQEQCFIFHGMQFATLF